MNSLHLFAGIGGAALGFQRAGITPVAACDKDEHCRAVLGTRFPSIALYDDVCALKAEQLSVRPDIITGGFPCQDVSAANWKGKGLEGHRSRLWYEQLRIIDESKPGYVVAENSPLLRSKGLDTLLGGLAEIGYDAEWHCIPAAHFGAPHQRDRIFILAYTDGFGPPRSRQLLTTLHPTPDAFREADRLVDAVRERALPFVCRGHDGLPEKLDARRQRLKQLGNTVVPSIFESIGRAILIEEAFK